MAAKAKDAKATPKVPEQEIVRYHDRRSKVDWNQVESSLAGAQDFLFPKPGVNRFRLVWSPQDEKPFALAKTTFNGKPKMKYVVLAYNLNEEPFEVKALVIPKTVFKSITGYQKEGYNLFVDTDGEGVSITKEGSGLNTSYNTIASKQMFSVPPAQLKQAAELSVVKSAAAYKKFQDDRSEVTPTAAEASKETAEPKDW